MSTDRLKDLRGRKSNALLGGGKQRIDDQHKKGKLTARERIELLIDEGTFEEIGMLVQHRSYDFGMETQKYWATASLQVTAKYRGVRCLFTARILLYLAGHSPKRTLRKFARSWTWR